MIPPLFSRETIMDNDLKQIMEACKGGVLFAFNNHITTDISISQYLYQLSTESDSGLGVDEQTRDMIVKLNTIFVIFLYVNAPVDGVVNYYRVIHYNYEQVLEDAVEVLQQLGKI